MLCQDIRQVIQTDGAGDHDHLIALLNGGHTTGDDDLAPADDGGQQHAAAQCKILQGLAQHGLCRGSGGKAQRLHLAAQQLVQRLHLTALGVAQCADIAGDLGGHNILGGDDGLDAGGCHQFHIVGTGHLGQHLGHAAHQRQHVDAEGIFQPGLLVKDIFYFLAVRAFFQFKDDTDAFLGGLVGNVGDFRQLFGFNQLGDIVQEFSDVAVKTLMGAIQPFLDWLEDKSIKEINETLVDKMFIYYAKGGEDMDTEINFNENGLTVILVVGVNGVGKTTSIAKLAYKLKCEGKKVMLCAADTFRAAAIDQLEVWSQRAGVPMIKQNEGSDPAAVVFDAINSAKSKKADVLIVDTAGRLHNKKNLMDELAKINRVLDRELEGAAREVLLVLDATTGQNAVSQAKEFSRAAGITGLVLTKLDGTAKGGIVIAVADSLQIPVKFIGVGEQVDDLMPLLVLGKGSTIFAPLIPKNLWKRFFHDAHRNFRRGV